MQAEQEKQHYKNRDSFSELVSPLFTIIQLVPETETKEENQTQEAKPRYPVLKDCGEPNKLDTRSAQEKFNEWWNEATAHTLSPFH